MATTPQRPQDRGETYEPRAPAPPTPPAQRPDPSRAADRQYADRAPSHPQGEEVGHHDVVPGREARGQRAKDAAEAYRAADDAAFQRATQGVPDDEVRDKILALGGDATRASPVWEQDLGVARPGLTTTTGAYRTPIDPTTAAVPAPEDSEIAMKLRGFPTIGSGRQSGTPEKLYQKREDVLNDRE